MRDRLHYNPEHVLAFLSWIHFLPISCGLSRANLLSETISLFFFPYYPYLFVVYGCFFFMTQPIPSCHSNISLVNVFVFGKYCGMFFTKKRLSNKYVPSLNTGGETVVDLWTATTGTT